MRYVIKGSKVEKEAIQVKEDNLEMIEKFVLNGVEKVYLDNVGSIVSDETNRIGYLVKTFTGTKRLARIGDYIVKFADDYYVPFAEEIFEKEFEKVLSKEPFIH